jgi:hypothetical protein
MLILINLYSFIESRDSHLVRTSWAIGVDSWVAVELNGMGLPSTTSPPGLRAVLPLPRRALRSKL